VRYPIVEKGQKSFFVVDARRNCVVCGGASRGDQDAYIYCILDTHLPVRHSRPVALSTRVHRLLAFMTTKAARANVLSAYRAILREIYKSVSILPTPSLFLVLSHIFAFQSISPRSTRSRTTALNFRAVFESGSTKPSDTQNAITFLRSQRMYKVGHVRLVL